MERIGKSQFRFLALPACGQHPPLVLIQFIWVSFVFTQACTSIQTRAKKKSRLLTHSHRKRTALALICAIKRAEIRSPIVNRLSESFRTRLRRIPTLMRWQSWSKWVGEFTQPNAWSFAGWGYSMPLSRARAHTLPIHLINVNFYNQPFKVNL